MVYFIHKATCGTTLQPNSKCSEDAQRIIHECAEIRDLFQVLNIYLTSERSKVSERVRNIIGLKQEIKMVFPTSTIMQSFLPL